MKGTTFRLIAFCTAMLLFGSVFMLPAVADELTVVFEENFDEYEAGRNAGATRLADFFTPDANAIGDGYIKVDERPDGNLYLVNHVFTQVVSRKPIVGPYEFWATVYEMQGPHRSGLFFRAPECTCAYYEADGSDATFPDSVGRSGIWVMVQDGGVHVIIKANDPTKESKVASLYHVFPLPESTDIKQNGAVVRIVDNETDARIFIDDTLICSLLFSEETGRKWKENGIDRANKLFQTVTMLDSEGNEVLRAENTYVCAEQSPIGWATRAVDMRIDNVRVLAKATETETVTEPETATEPESVPETQPVTAPATGTGVTEPATESTSAKDDPETVTGADTGVNTVDSGDMSETAVETVDDSLAIWILIAVMLVAIGATAGILAARQRRK